MIVLTTIFEYLQLDTLLLNTTNTYILLVSCTEQIFRPSRTLRRKRETCEHCRQAEKANLGAEQEKAINYKSREFKIARINRKS